LRPLRAVMLALSAPDPLQVRLPPADDLPRELAVMVESFDTLIGRFRNLLERERHFAATAAHELRTPLAGLSAQLQVLGMPDVPDPQALAQAQNAVRQIGTLIDHLLLLARMDANQVQARLEPIDMHELVLETAALVQDAWPQRDISWDIPQTGDICWQASGDPTLLRILLSNLLDNACKHGIAQPLIAVRMTCTGTQRELSIEDNGSGIPPEWMSLLQQRFMRASNQTTGLGLGLALVREIVHLHGGRLALGHSSLGGLRVSVTLAGAPASA
jgi:Signal transduction histidine kinase